MQRGGQRKLSRQHRILHFMEIHVQRNGKQIKGGRACGQRMINCLLQIVHHIARWFLRQQIAEGGMQTRQRIVDITAFPGRQNGVANRHKQLQRRLLAQYRLGINASGIAKQRRHQQGRVGNAGFLQLRLQRRQDVALNHIQQRVIARHFKAFAEQQLRGDFDVIAGAIIKLIMGDRHIGRAAANVNRGNAQRAAWR
ncbi:hypothetical protein D3C80_868550 [compost metagenome]